MQDVNTTQLTREAVERGADEDGRPPFESAVRMLQRHMEDVCRSAAAICITDYETLEMAAVSALVERSQALVSSALSTLDMVALLCGGAAQAPQTEAEAPAEGDHGDSRPPAPSEGLRDAVVLARIGLRSRQRSLLALSGGATRLEQLSAAGSALRTIQKSLSAVDHALSDSERIPPSLRFYRDAVERSLLVRQHYVRFQRAVLRSGPPSPSELRGRLRLIGNTITQMLGLDVAAHLRTGDRALLIMSHARIRSWLSQSDNGPAHVTVGLRLWQDLVNVATLLLDVNKREELVQHDARVVSEALRDLPSMEASWSEGGQGALVDRLRCMLGRSPPLDAILEGSAAAEIGEVRRLLEDLARTLGPRFDPPQTP